MADQPETRRESGGHVVVLRPGGTAAPAGPSRQHPPGRPLPPDPAPPGRSPAPGTGGPQAPGSTGAGTSGAGLAPGRPGAGRPPGGRGTSLGPAGLRPAAPAGRPRPAGRRRPRHSAATVARRRRVAVALLALLVAVPVLVVVRLGGSVAAPVLAPAAFGRLVAAGAAPALPWPAVGQGAVGVPSLGLVVQPKAQTPVPVASLTKMMTAYVVLRDHPLSPTASGPVITMTATDVADAAGDAARNDTMVPVVAGETLTERQLLDGLMVHSANNFADTLARWDAGSIAAFVARMNATAAGMGMGSTHYADASGVSHGSVSTAADQIRLAARAMASPTFAAIVDQRSVDLPLGGLLANYVQAVGTGGVVGIKSGFTQAALGCVVLAAYREVAGRRVLLLAAVTGQPGYRALDQAQSVGLGLIDAAAAALRVAPVVARGTVAGRVRVPWVAPAQAPVVRVARSVSVLAWPGSTVHRVLAASRPLRLPLAAGDRVGTLVVTEGALRVTVPLVLDGAVRPPSALWRLLR